jgi:hypothetical protein
VKMSSKSVEESTILAGLSGLRDKQLLASSDRLGPTDFDRTEM